MSTPGAASSQNPLVPPGFGGVPLPPAIPAPVQRAFVIWMVLIGLSVLSTIVQTAMGYSGVGSLILTIVLAAVGVFFALHFRGGRNWARIVLTVLTAIVLLFSVIGIIAGLALIAFAPGPILVSIVLSVISIAIGVLTLVYAWKPESSAYFARFS